MSAEETILVILLLAALLGMKLWWYARVARMMKNGDSHGIRDLFRFRCTIGFMVSLVLAPLFACLNYMILAAITAVLGLLNLAGAMYPGVATRMLAEPRCRKCGHMLRGITEPRCPECGERI